MKSILDPSFRYTKSVDTDLRKSFARIRREQRKQQQAASGRDVETLTKVLPIRQHHGETLGLVRRQESVRR